jgi:hypothetical protein
MKRFGLAVLVATLVSACGTTAPSEANLAGNWAGTMLSTEGTDQGTVEIVMTLTQAGASVSGTWGIAGLPFFQLANGSLLGTVTASSFSGTFTFNTLNPNGEVCTGTFAVSGNAGANMTWTSPGWTGSGNCTNLPTNISLPTNIFINVQGPNS